MSTLFSVTVVPYPALALAGLRITTSMAKASQDCPALWERFTPHMQTLCTGLCAENPVQASFGVSSNMDMATGSFKYMAALPAPLDAPLPGGLEHYTLPEGLYAKTSAPNLSQLEQAYMHIYEVWMPTQKTYVLNMAFPCFEYYDQRFLESGELDIYIPVQLQ